MNPETAQDVLPVLGFTAMLIWSGKALRPPLSSESALFHIIGGKGQSRVDGCKFDWENRDTFTAPVFAEIDHTTTGDDPAFMIRVSDRSLQEKLG